LIAYFRCDQILGNKCRWTLLRVSLPLSDPLQPLGIVEFVAFSNQGIDVTRRSWGSRKLSLRGKEGSVIGQQTPFLFIFLIEHIIERIAIWPPPLVRHKFRRNLHGQIRATLIVIFPSGDIADNFIIAVRQLSVNFSQRVSLKVKLTRRIRRLRFRLFVLPQCAKGPLFLHLIVGCSLMAKIIGRGLFDFL
jgi:hypothetical protein